MSDQPLQETPRDWIDTIVNVIGWASVIVMVVILSLGFSKYGYF